MKRTSKDIQVYIEQNHPDYMQDILLADGFEDAFMGVVESFGSHPKALYNKEACINILIERDGMNEEEALEHFSFNVEQAYVGEYTPAFMMPYEIEGIDFEYL